MIFVFRCVGTFCSSHIPFIRVCSMVISGYTPFLWTSMGILSVPGGLFLTDCIAVRGLVRLAVSFLVPVRFLLHIYGCFGRNITYGCL
jgi:hypothetical protein